MRYRFAREGVQMKLGDLLLDPGSLEFRPEIPVSYNNSFTPENIMGTASDITRDDDGWLTAEIDWNEAGEKIASEIDKTLFLTIYASHVQEDDARLQGGPRRIKKASLRVIFATLSEDPWEEAESDS